MLKIVKMKLTLVKTAIYSGAEKMRLGAKFDLGDDRPEAKEMV